MLLCFLKFGYPVSVKSRKNIFLKPPDSPVEYGIFFLDNAFIINKYVTLKITKKYTYF